MSEEMENPRLSPEPKNHLAKLRQLFDKNNIHYNKSYDHGNQCFFRFEGTQGTLDKVIGLVSNDYTILESGVPKAIVYEDGVIQRDTYGRSIRKDKGISFIYLTPKK